MNPAPAFAPRLPDWRLRLQEAIAATPAFAWGSHDCCRTAARWVAAMTGRDPAADIAGRYTDSVSAQACVDAAGGLHALLAARLGAGIAPQRAEVGDLVLVGLLHQRETLGVCVGDRIAAQGMDGAVYIRRERGIAAWRV